MQTVFCSAILFSYLAFRNTLNSTYMFSQSLFTLQCWRVFFHLENRSANYKISVLNTPLSFYQ